jgi:hypothetical protein
MFSVFTKLKPAASKNKLQFLAGSLWFGVGLMLDSFAFRWLKSTDLATALLFSATGIALAAGIYRQEFSKLAQKNIQRICSLSGEKICLFAFQAWSSYPLVAVMISLGIYLRVYSPFPKQLLSILYLGIGSALFAASLHYFAHITQRKTIRLEA